MWKDVVFLLMVIALLGVVLIEFKIFASLCSSIAYTGVDATKVDGGTLVAVLAILVTVLIGWNIWNTIKAKEGILELKEYRNEVERRITKLSEELKNEWGLNMPQVIPLLLKLKDLSEEKAIKECLVMYYENYEKNNVLAKIACNCAITWFNNFLYKEYEGSDNVSPEENREGHINQFLVREILTIEDIKVVERFIHYINSCNKDERRQNNLDEIKDILIRSYAQLYKRQDATPHKRQPITNKERQGCLFAPIAFLKEWWQNK